MADSMKPGVIRPWKHKGFDDGLHADFIGGLPLWDQRLIVAACYRRVDLVFDALTNGANVHRVDKTGYTALHWALYRSASDVVGRCAVATALLDAGADPTKRDSDGWTPLHIAAFWADSAEVYGCVLFHHTVTPSTRLRLLNAKNKYGEAAEEEARGRGKNTTAAYLSEVKRRTEQELSGDAGAIEWAKVRTDHFLP